MQVIKPVNTCEQCQQHFKQLQVLYGIYKACPSDPGAVGVLQAELDAYRQHHKEHHPIHPDAVVGR